jgi:hypothetical protein
MKRRVIPSLIILILGLTAGCTSYFTKKDEPPPLPAIEEPKPARLEQKSEYFKAFPWGPLGKARKDGNDPDTTMYQVQADDTLQSVAEKQMGDAGQADKLGEYNDLSPSAKLAPGDKIVVPNPFIGVESQIQVKGKKTFGEPQPFDTTLKKGDRYRMVFKTNVDGYLYVFRENVKTGVTMLYPAKAKKGRRNKNEEPTRLDTGKVKAFDTVYIPIGDKGFAADPKRKGENVMVFLSLRNIPDLEDMKEAKKISIKSLQDVMHGVEDAKILADGNLHLMRVSEPKKILGFSLNFDW